MKRQNEKGLNSNDDSGGSKTGDAAEKRADEIRVEGARTHNLKGVSVSLPRHKMTVVTGVSGSGKSSLAFDTIFAEGQRRYLESLPAYARMFLDKMDRPPVDRVTGLAPAISIAQHSTSAGPRSTVATITEIHDYARLLFTHLGTPHCPKCGRVVEAMPAEKIVEKLLELPDGAKLTLLAPLRGDEGAAASLAEAAEMARKAGFVRVFAGGEILTLEEAEARAAEAEARAASAKKSASAKTVSSSKAVSAVSAVVDRVVVRDGARARLTDSVEQALATGGGSMRVLRGDAQPNVASEKILAFSERNECPDCEIAFDVLKPASFSFNSPSGACPACQGLGVETVEQRHGPPVRRPCPACGGARMKPEILACRIDIINIADFMAMSVSAMRGWVETLPLDGRRREIAGEIISALLGRLDFLEKVGLGYLTCDRATATLSGGETQRVRLASQIGSGLSGVLYVLDEPTIGLHPRDNERLRAILHELRDRGNTLVVVEHDEEIIHSADHIIDIGPGAGRLGGELCFSGAPAEMLRSSNGLTARFLRGEEKPFIPARHAPDNSSASAFLEIRAARIHNLKRVTARIPLGCLTVVTGVSGSGKSSLITDVLRPNMEAYLALPRRLRADFAFIGCDAIAGADNVSKVIVMDGNPIGRSPRSNALTYTGAYALVRELFAATPAARARGYASGRFSFNVKGGRCEVCGGDGELTLEMSFLPEVTIPCPQCGGLRFNKETLEIKYAGRSIADILALTVEESVKIFANTPALARKLNMLETVGLGYLQLGQSASTLSGGEAQRLQLANELARPAGEKTLYLLDEPSAGLHFDDVRKLIKLLTGLRDLGHTIVVVEHNLDFMRAADWLLDLGPNGGIHGGELIASGPPEHVAESPLSHTAPYLRKGATGATGSN